MLSKVLKSRGRIHALRDDFTGTLFESFAQALSETGYATDTARRHIRAAEHFINWTHQHGMPVQDLNDQSRMEFNRHLGRCRCPHYGREDHVNVIHGARVFLNYLRNARILTPRAVKVPDHDPVLLSVFCGWMRQQRGTCDATLYNYRVHLREFLRWSGEEPSCFDAHKLREFALEKSRTCGWAAAKKCTTALRMFVRFLVAENYCSVGLDSAIPTLAHWRLAALPRYLRPEDVERLISSCNRTSPIGRRDRAILLLLARLGLRAGDIVNLRLSDIDGKGAWIHVCGKGRHHTRLPMTQEVGQAIVAYLQDGRPRTDAEALFVRGRAPSRAFSSHCAVSMIVDRALQRASIVRPSRGAAHLLRHSVATSMLRQGVSLEDIAVILRHRSIETTQIYSKVDITALRQIAQPWPEVQPC
jgi:integrase/recombinase XerD